MLLLAKRDFVINWRFTGVRKDHEKSINYNRALLSIISHTFLVSEFKLMFDILSFISLDPLCRMV